MHVSRRRCERGMQVEMSINPYYKDSREPEKFLDIDTPMIYSVIYCNDEQFQKRVDNLQEELDKTKKEKKGRKRRRKLYTSRIKEKRIEIPVSNIRSLVSSYQKSINARRLAAMAVTSQNHQCKRWMLPLSLHFLVCVAPLAISQFASTTTLLRRRDFHIYHLVIINTRGHGEGNLSCVYTHQ